MATIAQPLPRRGVAQQSLQLAALAGQRLLSSVRSQMLPDSRVRQRDYLLDITRAITSRLDLGEVLKLILQYSVEMLDGQAGLIALAEQDTARNRQTYQIRAAYGVAEDLLGKLQTMLTDARTTREASALLERNLMSIVQQVGMGFLEVVWLPLRIGGDVLGNLYIMRMRGGGFTPDDRQILQTFADQAAIAVNNAQMYEQLAREKRRLDVADEMKSTFISAVSHELKTPIALIKGYATTMSRPDAHWDEATMRDSLQVIEEESDRLTELVNNLLDASRAQNGAFKLSPVELDIDEVVTKTARKFNSQTHKHKISIKVPHDLPLVYADEARITQVIGNLISNAIKYSPNGGEIRVSGEANSKEVIIHVSDQGKGIAAADLPHVFERFYRAKDATTKQIPGTGLGLYLAKEFIDAHHGRIWVESDGKSGSTFHFALPRA